MTKTSAVNESGWVEGRSAGFSPGTATCIHPSALYKISFSCLPVVFLPSQEFTCRVRQEGKSRERKWLCRGNGRRANIRNITLYINKTWESITIRIPITKTIWSIYLLLRCSLESCMPMGCFCCSEGDVNICETNGNSYQLIGKYLNQLASANKKNLSIFCNLLAN